MTPSGLRILKRCYGHLPHQRAHARGEEGLEPSF